LYLRLMRVVKVDCRNNHIKQAIEEDVTLYEAFKDMNFRLSKSKEYPTISIMLNALFLQHKDEIFVETTPPIETPNPTKKLSYGIKKKSDALVKEVMN